MSRDNLKEGFYWLISACGERALVYCYRNPDENLWGFGFNYADGGGFLPLRELTNSTVVFEARVRQGDMV